MFLSESHAASFQQQYQQLIEEILKKVLKKEDEQQKKKPAIRIIDGDRVIYGEVDGQFRDELTPQKAAELQKLISTPVGGIVEGATPKNLEIGGQVVLRSDENGRVILNTLTDMAALREEASLGKSAIGEVVGGRTPPPFINRGNPQVESSASNVHKLWTTYPTLTNNGQALAESQSDLKDDRAITNFRASLNEGDLLGMKQVVADLSRDSKIELFGQLTNEERLKAMEVVLAREFPTPTHSTSSSSASVDQQLQAQSQQQQEGAFARVQTAIEQLPAQLQQIVSAQADLMQQVRQQQQQEKLLPALEQLIQQRLSQPQEASWWYQLKVATTRTFASISGAITEYSRAASLKDLFHAKSPNGNVYQAEKYSIKKEGDCYSLLDKKENTLMQFTAPMGLIKVDRRSTRLDDSQKRDLNLLSLQQSKPEQPAGGFASAGTREAKHLARINAITSALTQYAAKVGQTVQVDGQFSYKWTASPNGSVKIEAKDDRVSNGNSLLLIQGRGGVHSQMNDRDLAYFEKIVPVLQAQSPGKFSSPVQSASDLLDR